MFKTDVLTNGHRLKCYSISNFQLMNIRKKVRGLSTREKKKIAIVISIIFIISEVISFQSVKKNDFKRKSGWNYNHEKLGLNVWKQRKMKWELRYSSSFHLLIANLFKFMAAILSRIFRDMKWRRIFVLPYSIYKLMRIYVLHILINM